MRGDKVDRPERHEWVVTHLEIRPSVPVHAFRRLGGRPCRVGVGVPCRRISRRLVSQVSSGGPSPTRIVYVGLDTVGGQESHANGRLSVRHDGRLRVARSSPPRRRRPVGRRRRPRDMPHRRSARDPGSARGDVVADGGTTGDGEGTTAIDGVTEGDTVGVGEAQPRSDSVAATATRATRDDMTAATVHAPDAARTPATRILGSRRSGAQAARPGFRRCGWPPQGPLPGA